MGHSDNDAVHKIPHKMKTHWQNQLEFRYWFNLYSSMDLDIERLMLYLSNAPLMKIFILFLLSGSLNVNNFVWASVNH